MLSSELLSSGGLIACEQLTYSEAISLPSLSRSCIRQFVLAECNFTIARIFPATVRARTVVHASIICARSSIAALTCVIAKFVGSVEILSINNNDECIRILAVKLHHISLLTRFRARTPQG